MIHSCGITVDSNRGTHPYCRYGKLIRFIYRRLMTELKPRDAISFITHNSSHVLMELYPWWTPPENQIEYERGRVEIKFSQWVTWQHLLEEHVHGACYTHASVCACEHCPIPWRHAAPLTGWEIARTETPRALKPSSREFPLTFLTSVTDANAAAEREEGIWKFNSSTGSCTAVNLPDSDSFMEI